MTPPSLLIGPNQQPKHRASQKNIHDSDIGRYIKVFHENMSLKKKWLNPLRKYLVVGLKESERIFDFDKY